jgi:predicted TIM-barrel fold metal-dependent hydrolase
MQTSSYIGFPAVPETDTLVDSLMNDPPEVRWRWVRAMLRIEDPQQLQTLHQTLQKRMMERKEPLDWRVALRVQMALHACQRPVRVNGYAVVKGKGAFTTAEVEAAGTDPQQLEPVKSADGFYPVIDFHVHPKMPDLKFLSDMRRAGISHAVILATDTDPANVDRPEIIERLKEQYERSEKAGETPFEKTLRMIRNGIYSRSHVTDQDVADWVETYPDVFIGFGSVDLCKSDAYVKEKLEKIESLKLRGIKLLPYSQFFNPAENGNMSLLFDFCQRTGAIVLSHTGCAAGAFELSELSQNSRPELWEPVARKYPDVPVVLAHFASYSNREPGIWFEEALALMKKCPNVYADISAAPYLLKDPKKVEKIREATGFKQVLFATDYPGPLYHGIALEGIVADIKTNSFLSDEEKRWVLGENGSRLLGGI